MVQKRHDFVFKLPKMRVAKAQKRKILSAQLFNERSECTHLTILAVVLRKAD
jgi:hypothetical protein